MWDEDAESGTGVRTFGGLTLGLRGASVDDPAAALAASAAIVFLFLLPGGRPRFRLGVGSGRDSKIARSTSGDGQ